MRGTCRTCIVIEARAWIMLFTNANVQKHEVLFFVLKTLELPQEVDVVAVQITALSCPTPAIRVVPKPYWLEVRPRGTGNEFSSRWLSEIVGYSNMADYSSSTVVGRALILPVLSCNDVYVIFEPHFKQNLSPGLTYYCTPRRNPPCWDESKLAAIFYWPTWKIFYNCCGLVPKKNVRDSRSRAP